MAGIVPAVAEPKRKATYDDVLAAPENEVAEIIDGELIVRPRPGSPHAVATSVLGADLLGAFHGPPGDPHRSGGWWILDEPELHLLGDVIVPDIAGWRRERMPRVPSVSWFDVPPDWVCESLSASTARIDRGPKLDIYAREGVAHVWLLDPIARMLEVLQLDATARYLIAAVHGGADKPRAVPFEAIELDLSRLWLD